MAARWLVISDFVCSPHPQTACDLGTVTLTNLGTVLGGPARVGTA